MIEAKERRLKTLHSINLDTVTMLRKLIKAWKGYNSIVFLVFLIY